MSKILLILAIGLTLLTFVLLQDYRMMGKSGSSPVTGQGVGKAAIGGAFALTDTAGRPFTDAALKGKVALVFFGFTHCPDICPVTMATLSGVMKTLGEDAGQVIPVFITVDPERDTPKVMKEYVDNFDSRIVGLTGTREQVEEAAAAYKVYHAKVEPAPAEKKEDGHHAHDDGGHGGHGAHHGGGDGDNYMVNHSGFVYVMDREGNYITHLPFDAPENEVIKTLKPYLD